MRLLLPLVCCLAILACSRTIDCTTVNGFREGVTTLQEAVEILGKSDSVVAGENGSQIYAWRYTTHTYTGGGSQTDITLTFGKDGKLMVKRCSTKVQGALVKEPAA